MEHFAVKRITQELSELQKHASPNFCAEPVGTDLFDWHFTLKGPSQTPYEEGLYHGRLILPLNYPLKPPKFLMLNNNGRFEVGREICMSNTSYHPDEWQPAWTIRTMLEGLVSFFPEETDGAIGALRASDDVRKGFAKSSWNFKCDQCGRLGEIWGKHKERFEVKEESKEESKGEIKEENKGEEGKFEENKGLLENVKKIIEEEGKEEEKVENKEEEEEEKKEEAARDIKEKYKNMPGKKEVEQFYKKLNTQIRVLDFMILGLLGYIYYTVKFY